MHIFRFETGKIAELWDFGQPVPENPVAKTGCSDSTTGSDLFFADRTLNKMKY